MLLISLSDSISEEIELHPFNILCPVIPRSGVELLQFSKRSGHRGYEVCSSPICSISQTTCNEPAHKYSSISLLVHSKKGNQEHEVRAHVLHHSVITTFSQSTAESQHFVYHVYPQKNFVYDLGH